MVFDTNWRNGTVRRWLSTLVVLLSLMNAAGCGDEAVDLTPTTTPMEDQGTVQDAGIDMNTEQPADMGQASMLYPDEAAFVAEILPILIQSCGPSCHEYAIDPSNNNSPGGNDYEVFETDIAGSMAEVLHPSFGNPQDPAASEVIVHHGGMYYRTIDDKIAVRDWIADAAIPKGTTPSGPSGPSELSCNHLPSGDGIGPPGWFANFENNINPMFVGTAEEPERGYCAGSGCHTVVDAGGDLDFLPPSDPCSARWNFIVSQSFIDINNQTASPLLRQPLGEPTLDPTVSTHGGQEVFKGQDENYQLLRGWITEL